MRVFSRLRACVFVSVRCNVPYCCIVLLSSVAMRSLRVFVPRVIIIFSCSRVLRLLLQSRLLVAIVAAHAYFSHFLFHASFRVFFVHRLFVSVFCLLT